MRNKKIKEKILLLSLRGFNIKLWACQLSDRKQIIYEMEENKCRILFKGQRVTLFFSCSIVLFDNYRCTLMWLSSLFFIVKVEQCNLLKNLINYALLMYSIIITLKWAPLLYNASCNSTCIHCVVTYIPSVLTSFLGIVSLSLDKGQPQPQWKHMYPDS